jgi:hypothetical protein
MSGPAAGLVFVGSGVAGSGLIASGVAELDAPSAFVAFPSPPLSEQAKTPTRTKK